MKEYASTMKKRAVSIALARHNTLVNGVIPIDVIFMNVKMEGLVLSIWHKIFLHQDVNVLKLTTAQPAI